MKHTRLMLTAGLLLAACAVAADPGRLLERLRTDHAAMVAAEQDFHARRQRGSLNGTEAADYAAYVARLHRRVAEDCVALTDAGSIGVVELPSLDVTEVITLSTNEPFDAPSDLVLGRPGRLYAVSDDGLSSVDTVAGEEIWFGDPLGFRTFHQSRLLPSADGNTPGWPSRSKAREL